MRKFLLLAIAVISYIGASAQVTEMQYTLNYNCSTSLYEVGIFIAEGQANSISTRAQFNAQVTIIVPTGLEVVEVETFNPILENQDYNGTVPQDWIKATPAISPTATPDFDYHPFQPRLNPAAFYNDLMQGDQVVMFTIQIGDAETNNDQIRLYDNVNDVPIGSGDFRNGFTLGSPIQIYNGNIRQICGEGPSNTKDVKQESSVYPNPATDRLQIATSVPYDGLSIRDLAGRVHLAATSTTSSIDISHLSSGVYMIIIQRADHTEAQRFIKI